LEELISWGGVVQDPVVTGVAFEIMLVAELGEDGSKVRNARVVQSKAEKFHGFSYFT